MKNQMCIILCSGKSGRSGVGTWRASPPRLGTITRRVAAKCYTVEAFLSAKCSVAQGLTSAVRRGRGGE